MTTIAVVAHLGSTLGGGLEELREVLAAEGVTDLLCGARAEGQIFPLMAPPGAQVLDKPRGQLILGGLPDRSRLSVR